MLSPKQYGLVIALALIFHGLSAFAQSANDPVTIMSMTPSNNVIVIRWEGGIPPYKLQRRTATNGWVDYTFHIYAQAYAVPMTPEVYFFRVRTVADRVAPQIPSGLGGTATACDRINLSWTALACGDARWCGDNDGGTGLRGYRLYRDGTFVREVTSLLRTNVDTGLVGSRAYSYTVSSIDKAGNESAQSAPVVISTPACNPGSGNGSVTLAWDASSTPLSGYVLRYGTTRGVYTNAINVGNLTTTTVSSLAAGTTYYFVVTAYQNSGLESDPSNEVSFVR